MKKAAGDCPSLHRSKQQEHLDGTTNLFDVLVLIDTRCEGRGEPFVDVRLGRQFLQGLHSVLGEELLFGVLVQTVQTLLVRLAEVDGVYVRLVHGLHVALARVHAHGDRSVDTCKDIWDALLGFSAEGETRTGSLAVQSFAEEISAKVHRQEYLLN